MVIWGNKKMLSEKVRPGVNAGDEINEGSTMARLIMWCLNLAISQKITKEEVWSPRLELSMDSRRRDTCREPEYIQSSSSR